MSGVPKIYMKEVNRLHSLILYGKIYGWKVRMQHDYVQVIDSSNAVIVQTILARQQSLDVGLCGMNDVTEIRFYRPGVDKHQTRLF